MKQTICCIGDSLSLPRSADELECKDVYWMQLQQTEDIAVYPFVRKSMDTEHFINEEGGLYYAIKYAPSDYYIILLGIVDCSPRLFSKRQKSLLKLLEGIGMSKIANRYVKHNSKRRMYFTKKRQIVNVSLHKFEENYNKIIEAMQVNNPKKIICTTIAYPGEYLTTRSYGILDNIINYNNVIGGFMKKYDNVELIDLFNFTKENLECILADGHHINKIGHNFIYSELRKILKV